MLRERVPGARTRGKQLVAVVPPAPRTPQNAVPGTASHPPAHCGAPTARERAWRTRKRAHDDRVRASLPVAG